MALVKLNNRGVRSATTFGSISALGEMRFIKKITASSSATVSFVNGSSDVVLDNTYKEYLFTFNNIHPATNNTTFGFNVSTDTGSNYNIAKTTTVTRGFNNEADSSTLFDYLDGIDLAQGTGAQALVENIGNENDESVSGYLQLFDPSNTTFVKHFIWQVPSYAASNAINIQYGAGYANTTSAIDAVQFSMGSGNIDAGDICLYGIA